MKLTLTKSGVEVATFEVTQTPFQDINEFGWSGETGILEIGFTNESNTTKQRKAFSIYQDFDRLELVR